MRQSPFEKAEQSVFYFESSYGEQVHDLFDNAKASSDVVGAIKQSEFYLTDLVGLLVTFLTK